MEKIIFDIKPEPYASNGSLVLFEDGDENLVQTEDQPIRFLLLPGNDRLSHCFGWLS